MSTKNTKDTKMEEELLFRDECYAIQGAVFEVYREMGSGFLESVYQECLEKELRIRGIPFIAQQGIAMTKSFRHWLTLAP